MKKILSHYNLRYIIQVVDQTHDLSLFILKNKKKKTLCVLLIIYFYKDIIDL